MSSIPSTIDLRKTPDYLDSETIRESLRTTQEKLSAYEKAKSGQPTELVDKLTRMHAILECYKLKPRKRDKALNKFKPFTAEELKTINKIQNLPSKKMAEKATEEQKKLIQEIKKLHAELGMVLKGSSHEEIMKNLREKVADKLKEKEQGWISWFYNGVKKSVEKLASASWWTLKAGFKTVTFPLRHPLLTALIAAGGTFAYLKYAPVRSIINTTATWIMTAAKAATPYIKKAGQYLAPVGKKIIDYGSKALKIIKDWWKKM